MDLNLTATQPALAILEYSDCPKEQAADLIKACRAIADAAQHRPAGALPTRALMTDLRAALTTLDLNPRVR